MPKLGISCKFYTLELDEDDDPIFGCKKGYTADAECIIKGKPKCPGYKKGLRYSLGEVKEKYRLT